MRRSLIFFAASLLVLFFTSSAFAVIDPIPHMINYQGMLTNDEGTPLNGLYDLTFRIYDVPSGGSALWTGNYNDEEVLDGLFNVILDVPASVFSGAERYMGITVWPNAELTPRTRLTSVGYAYVAETAVTSGTDGDWTVSGNNLYSAVSGDVGIGITSPGSKLHVRDAGSYGQITVDGSIRGAVVFGDNNDGADAKYHYIRSDGEKLYMGKVNDAFSVWYNSFVMDRSTGNIGIGTTTPSEKLEVAGNMKISGTITGQVPGVEYSNASGLGTQTSLSTSWLTLKSVTVTHPGDGYVVCIGTGHADWDVASFTGNIEAGWTTSSTGTPDSYNRISLYAADGTTYIPIAAMHTYQVSGEGSTTFYFRARISSGLATDMDFFEGSVAAMYFPTHY